MSRIGSVVWMCYLKLFNPRMFWWHLMHLLLPRWCIITWRKAWRNRRILFILCRFLRPRINKICRLRILWIICRRSLKLPGEWESKRIYHWNNRLLLCRLWLKMPLWRNSLSLSLVIFWRKLMCLISLSIQNLASMQVTRYCRICRFWARSWVNSSRALKKKFWKWTESRLRSFCRKISSNSTGLNSTRTTF